MKAKRTLSLRTIVLLAAAALLVACGAYTGTRAQLEYFSQDYIADFELDHIHVHLVENGVDVCHDYNRSMSTVHREDDGSEKQSKYRGNLLEHLGYLNPEGDSSHYSDGAAYTLGTPGTVKPGWTYKEEICTRNSQNVDEYVRLTIRKYWVKDGKKATDLSPAMIRLSYNGKDYNSGAWQLNKAENEGSEETATYYLTNVLKARADGADYRDSDLLFNELTIDSSVLDTSNMTVSTKENKDGNKISTVYTYSYDYDGYTFYIEADVQSIQTHNVNDAISSLWGVSNVSAAGGRITVK